MIEQLHKAWGVEQYATLARLQGAGTFTCYESVAEQLADYTKARYQGAPEQTIQEVFDIYRSINIVPIEYYTEPIQHAPIVLKSFVMINSLLNYLPDHFLIYLLILL